MSSLFVKVLSKEHGAWSIGKYSWQQAASSRQRTEDRGQRLEVASGNFEIRNPQSEITKEYCQKRRENYGAGEALGTLSAGKQRQDD
jgi:hypothetical protein